MAADRHWPIAAVVLAAVTAAAACRGVPDEHPAPDLRGTTDVAPALALCRAVQTVPRTRRAACCAAPADAYEMLHDQCVDLLSTSIREGAVTLDDAEVGACGTAMAAMLEGCEWVQPVLPPPPAACIGIVHGQLEAGQACRSSLECHTGLHCDGVHPRAPGTCRAPKAEGETCSRTIDPLQGLLGHGVDPDHPECATGPCRSHRCIAATPEGGACETSRMCGPGSRCAEGRCATGLAGLGEACTDHDACSDGVCVDGTCVVPEAAGASCSSSAQCHGACLRQDDGNGVCGPRCSATIPEVAPPLLRPGRAAG